MRLSPWVVGSCPIQVQGEALMRVVSRRAIEEARKPYCERCGRRDMPIHVHHVRARGMGSGKRMDVPGNLISLCALCHDAAHRGVVSREEIWRIVERRSH